MTSYIKGSAADPLVQGEARRAVSMYPSPMLAMSGLSPNDPRLTRADREQAAAESCWAWAKHNLEFVHHSKLLLLWMGNQDALQLLISPDVIVHALYGDDAQARQRAKQGDCAVFSPMVCALLEANGLDWELVIAAVDPNQPEIFSHVWPRVVLSDGRRVSLDASHGPYPGWQVPANAINRLQVFNSAGRAIADQGSTFSGLHEYIGTGFNAGLGSICDDSGNCYDDAGGLIAVDPYNPSGSTNVGSPPGGWPSTSPSNSAATTNLLSSLLNQWTQIGGRVIAPQTTYTVGPNGQVSYSTPGAAPVPTNLSTSLGGSSIMPWLLGGGLLIAALAFGGKK